MPEQTNKSPKVYRQKTGLFVVLFLSAISIYSLINKSAFLVIAQTLPQRQYDEVIVGNNDLVQVDADGSNISSELKSVFLSVGKLGKSCTATHLGNGYVITAGHCLLPAQSNRVFTLKKDKKWAESACIGKEISWGTVNQSASSSAVPSVNFGAASICKTVIYAAWTPKADIAILNVLNPPDFSAELEKTLPSKIDLDSKVSVLSYPGGAPLSWSGPCNIRSRIQTQRFIHDCDTERGSSGAPVFLPGNGSAKIVGIHNGGTTLNNGTFVSALPKYVTRLLESANEPNHKQSNSQRSQR